MKLVIYRIKVLLISIFFTFPVISVAQSGGDINIIEDSVVDMYIVVGSGLGGALLGLSTLSFVSEPSDHLKNILVGGALGVIAGVAVVAYSTANKGKDLYESVSIDNGEFATGHRVAWHHRSFKKHFVQKEIPQLFYNFTF